MKDLAAGLWHTLTPLIGVALWLAALVLLCRWIAHV